MTDPRLTTPPAMRVTASPHVEAEPPGVGPGMCACGGTGETIGPWRKPPGVPVAGSPATGRDDLGTAASASCVPGEVVR